jgi:RNA polymerase sigma-70 factor (ECF subfamily)
MSKREFGIKSFKEQEKIFRERTGNEFSFFYEKYYPKLIYYTQKFCTDQQKAEDVTTDAFMDALDKIDSYDKEKAQFSTWLFRIARNLMLQEIKSQRKLLSIDNEFDDEGTTLKDFLTSEEYDYSSYELTTKKSEILKEEIKKLKEPYRQVIKMREIEGMKYQEIADTLNTNLSTIKSRIKKSREMLIKQSKKDFDILEKFS